MEEDNKKVFVDSLRIRILIVLISIILIVLMFPKGESLESEVSVGSIWIQDDLIASKTFEILKDPEAYRQEREAAAQKVNPIFVYNEDAAKDQVDSLESYNAKFVDIVDQALLSPSLKGNSTFLSDESFQRFVNLRRLNNIQGAKNGVTLRNVFAVSKTILQRIFNKGLVNKSLVLIAKDTITVREGKYEKFIPKKNFYDDEAAKSFIELYVRNNLSTQDELKSAIEEYVYHFVRPNYIYSEGFTNAAIETAKDKVTRNVGIVNENERIVAKHDRITPETKLKIDSYRVAKGESTGFWGGFTQNIGKALHVIAILVLFSVYIFLFRKKIYHDNVKILLICIIVLLISSLAFISQLIIAQVPIEYLILVPAGSMLLTIIFDSRIGFYGTVVISFIAGGLLGNDYVFSITNIVAGALAAYTVRDIKNRTQIFRSFMFILTGYILSILAFGLERFASPEQLLLNIGFAAANSLISPVLTFGLIIFFERIFKITTDLTLLELTDFNSTLLKELAAKAPGTFSHSMTMGSLVETAAEDIGANPILARVGAYYHDIGKSFDPSTFVENQLDNKNVHEKLNPQKSAQLIIDHVKKGIEHARKNNLPQEVLDFIPMHHGTMVVSFFYERAKKEFGEDNVDINNYRYPGPKPNTKETALVMLADACESTVRSMTDSDPKKVENVINNLVKQRMEDGQLDDAPITMKDLKVIKESFASILIGQHHKRIRYPKQEELEDNE